MFVRILYWFVALEFLLGAVTKYWPGPTFFGPAYSEKFVDWGYPSWVRFLVGGIEFVSAVLLVTPSRRFRFVGATALVFVLTGAVTTHIVNHHQLYESIMAPIHLVIVGVIALANWPADWRDLFRGFNFRGTGTRRRGVPGRPGRSGTPFPARESSDPARSR